MVCVLCMYKWTALGIAITFAHLLTLRCSHPAPLAHPPTPGSYTFKVNNKKQQVPIVLVAYEGDGEDLGGLGVYRVGTAK